MQYWNSNEIENPTPLLKGVVKRLKSTLGKYTLIRNFYQWVKEIRCPLKKDSEIIFPSRR